MERLQRVTRCELALTFAFGALCHGAVADQFITIDVPGATYTAAAGIDSEGDIVGTFEDSSSKVHGFLLRNGAFTTIDPPGAVETSAAGINTQGNIVGVNRDSSKGHFSC